MGKGRTATGIVFEVAGDSAGRALPVVLLHAGVADRRMWDEVWDELTADRVVLRLDLRGFGDSIARPIGPLINHVDVLATMDAVGVRRAHLVGASVGAGVAGGGGALFGRGRRRPPPLSPPPLRRTSGRGSTGPIANRARSIPRSGRSSGPCSGGHSR